MMPTYNVPVKRTTLELYRVEARNGTEAGLLAAQRIADPAQEPDESHAVAVQVMAARTVGTP
jgi:hypothetical protein